MDMKTRLVSIVAVVAAAAFGNFTAVARPLSGVNGKDVVLTVSPNQSLEEARDRARAIRATRIRVLEGTYRLDRPLTLGPEDSGVVWEAEGSVIVSGAANLTWRSPRADEIPASVPAGARSHLLMADLPGPVPGFSGGFSSSQCFSHDQTEIVPKWSEFPISVFDGGRRLPCARWPRHGMTTTGKCFGKELFINDLPTYREGVFAFENRDFPMPDLSAWERERDLWCYILTPWDYTDTYTQITNVNATSRTLAIDMTHVFGNRIRTGREYFVFNSFSELNAPGTWAVDRAARKIYLWPSDDVRSSPVVAWSDGLLRAKGVSDVVISGFTFEATRSTALDFEDCTNVVVRKSTVRNTSGTGMRIMRGRGNAVVGCDLYELGQGGVWMCGGERRTLTPANHVVDNCHIHDCGKVTPNYRPAIQLNGVGCRATHNLIHDMRHAAIIFHGNDHYIGWNIVHDTCTENWDAGAIYTYTEDDWGNRGTVVEYNTVFMTGRQPRASTIFSIYLDGYSCGTTVRHNIVNRGTIGLFTQFGHCNAFETNLVVNCSRSMQRSCSEVYGDCAKGRESVRFKTYLKNLDMFKTPVWAKKYPELLDIYKMPDSVFAQAPLYCRFVGNVMAASGKWRLRDEARLADWTVCSGNVMLDEDPGFVDYEGMNWELKPDAAARKALGCGTRFAEMGLYESSFRASPARKWGENVTRPRPIRREYEAPEVVLFIDFLSKLPDGVLSFAEDMDQVWSQPSNGKRLNTRFEWLTTPSYSEWRGYSCSFTPTADGEAQLWVFGGGGEKTFYDEFRVTGTKLENGGFEDGMRGWKLIVRKDGAFFGDVSKPIGVFAATDEYPAASGKGLAAANALGWITQNISLKKGQRVTIEFKARAYIDRPCESP